MGLTPPRPNKQPQDTYELVGECLYRNTSSGTYYALIKRGGKQFRRSLRTKDRALANRRVVDYRKKVTRLNDVTGGSKITFAELSERWMKTIEAQLKRSSSGRRRSSLNNLLPTFGSTPVRNISTRMCEDWMLKRSAGIAASTFNIDLETLRSVLALAKRDGLILENPTDAISRRRTEKTAVNIPSKEQFQKLIATMRDLDARAQHGVDLVELLAYSGMRLGEAIALRWSDVDFERNLFTVTGGEIGTKNHEARTVPIFPALRALLIRLKKERDADPTILPEAPIIPIQTAKKSLATACKKAGLPDYGHHAMRHFFVSNAIEVGIDFKAIAGWVGHKDGGILVAKTYGHLRDIHSFEMAKKMTFNSHE